MKKIITIIAVIFIAINVYADMDGDIDVVKMYVEGEVIEQFETSKGVFELRKNDNVGTKVIPAELIKTPLGKITKFYKFIDIEEINEEIFLTYREGYYFTIVARYNSETGDFQKLQEVRTTTVTKRANFVFASNPEGVWVWNPKAEKLDFLPDKKYDCSECLDLREENYKLKVEKEELKGTIHNWKIGAVVGCILTTVLVGLL